jgi:transposase InsO family protein
MGHQARWEYFRAVYGRYQEGSRKVRLAILNEFCLNTGYHRKYAIRLLNGTGPGKRASRGCVPRRRALKYGPKTLAVLTAVWEAAGYPWSVRLKALLPMWMPWMGKRFGISPETERQLLAISPRQMDRRLRPKKMQERRRMYGRTKPGLLLKHQIPVKTDSWDVRTPGFTEIDLVSHSGNSGAGEFGHSLNVTDIHSGWTESRAVLGRSQQVVLRALNEVEQGLPFALRGVDSDNGSEFINRHLQAWCQQKNIQRTRGRPYKKDDNAHIEQKNWTHVRKLLGWDRYDSEAALEAMNDLYRKELRWMLNLYQPSVKMVKKVRVGSKLRRVYDRPQTPLERVARSEQADTSRLAELTKLKNRLDPFELAHILDRKLKHIYGLANHRLSPGSCPIATDRRKRLRPDNGCGKAAPWKSPKADFPTALGNPAKSAGFPLSHTRAGGSLVTYEMARQPTPKLHS